MFDLYPDYKCISCGASIKGSLYSSRCPSCDAEERKKLQEKSDWFYGTPYTEAEPQVESNPINQRRPKLVRIK